MEVTKALAALQPLYGKGNIEIVTARWQSRARDRAQHENNPGADYAQRWNRAPTARS